MSFASRCCCSCSFSANTKKKNDTKVSSSRGRKTSFFSSSSSATAAATRKGRKSSFVVGIGEKRGGEMTRRAASSSSHTEKRTALVPIANGSEEMEAIIIADVLRRAGVEVTVASCEDDLVCDMSRNVRVRADCSITEHEFGSSFDAIVVPGGMPGAERLAQNAVLDALLKRQSEEKKVIAAMCAAPAVVLLSKNLLAEASEATAHPAFDLGEAFAKDKKKRVCYSKSSSGQVVITSQGPGTAIEFALALVKELCGEEKRKEVAGPMCVPEDVLMG